MKNLFIGIFLGLVLMLGVNSFSAITLTTPIVTQPAISEKVASKIKVTSIKWLKNGTNIKMMVTYSDDKGQDFKSFDNFSKDDCKSVRQRVENRMMNYPEFAGIASDDIDE